MNTFMLMPVIIIQLAVQIFTIYKIVKATKFKFFNKPIWIVIALLGLIGVICYFIFGRKDD